MPTHTIKRGNSKLTLSIDSRVLQKFKLYCDGEGMIISKQVENFMKDKIKSINKKRGE